MVYCVQHKSLTKLDTNGIDVWNLAILAIPMYLPITTIVLPDPTPTTFLAATDTVYCCSREFVTWNVC